MTVEADEPLVETEQLLGTIESGTTVEEMAVAYQKLLVIFRQDPDFNWSNSISLASRLTACFKRELDRLINDMGDEDINSSEDLSFPAMRCMGYFMYAPNLVKLLSDAECSELLHTICSLISAEKSVVSQNNLSLALWCLSTQRLSAKLIVGHMSTIINSLQLALEYPADNVKAESLGCLLNICRQAPTAALLYNSLWLNPVILNCAHPMLNIRDKAEHILAFMVPLFAENHERTDSAVTSFFKNHALEFGKNMESLECKARFLIRVWAHLAVVFSKWLAHSDFMGCFLRLIERCFNDSNSDIRKFTYQAWGRLVYNFSVFGMHERRATLLMTPILTCLEREKTKAVRLACIKVWLKLLCAISRNYQEFYDTVISPVLLLLSQDPLDEMRLLGLQTLSCLIYGTEHKSAINNLRLLADDLSPQDANIKSNTRWCRAHIKSFLGFTQAFAHASPKNNVVQTEAQKLQSRLLEIITDLNCEELKHTPDSVLATRSALEHLHKSFLTASSDHDWAFALKLAKSVFLKISGRILVCPAYEIKIDELNYLPWEFVFVAGFGADKVSKASIDVISVDDLLQTVLNEDPLAYDGHDRYLYIQRLLECFYSAAKTTDASLSFWNRMVMKYAAIKQTLSDNEANELFVRPIISWINLPQFDSLLQFWKDTCKGFLISSTLSTQEFFIAIIGSLAKEDFIVCCTIANALIENTDEKLPALFDFARKMISDGYENFPSQDDEESIYRWIQAVDSAFRVTQHTIALQPTSETVAKWLDFFENDFIRWIEDPQKHYCRLEIADINKALNLIDSLWSALLQANISCKDFSVVQPIYESGLSCRRKKIAAITMEFWLENWSKTVSKSNISVKFKALLKANQNMEFPGKREKKPPLMPPSKVIIDEKPISIVIMPDSVESTPPRTLSAALAGQQSEPQAEKLSEDLFKTPKSFELKRKSGPLYSPAFLTPPSILKSRSKPSSKFREPPASKMRRVSFMFADEPNCENNKHIEGKETTAVITPPILVVDAIIETDSKESAPSSTGLKIQKSVSTILQSSPAQMLLDHADGLMQNRANLCAMSLRQLLDLQRKLHAVMQDVTESMGRFSQQEH